MTTTKKQDSNYRYSAHLSSFSSTGFPLRNSSKASCSMREILSSSPLPSRKSLNSRLWFVNLSSAFGICSLNIGSCSQNQPQTTSAVECCRQKTIRNHDETLSLPCTSSFRLSNGAAIMAMAEVSTVYWKCTRVEIQWTRKGCQLPGNEDWSMIDETRNRSNMLSPATATPSADHNASLDKGDRLDGAMAPVWPASQYSFLASQTPPASATKRRPESHAHTCDKGWRTSEWLIVTFKYWKRPRFCVIPIFVSQHERAS